MKREETGRQIKGGRLKGSSPSANHSNGSLITNLLGRWSLYDAAFKWVHPASGEDYLAQFTVLGAFKYVHPASGEDDWAHFPVFEAFICVHLSSEEYVLAHFTSLGAIKCVHPGSEAVKLQWKFVEPSANVIVAAREQGGPA